MDKRIPYFWTRSRGHIITMYPIAPALVILPLVAPQVAVLDSVRPGWDRLPVSRSRECSFMAKRSMAVIVALTGVVLYRLLLLFGLGRTALAGRSGRMPRIGPVDRRQSGGMATRAGGSASGHDDRAHCILSQ